MLKDQVRSLLDRNAPGVSSVYRQWLDSRRASAEPVYLDHLGFRFTGNARMASGNYEHVEVGLLTKLLPAADRAIDVGANIGFYVCLCRHLGKPVVAFEPLPANLAILFANLRANGWSDTEVWPIGLGERAECLEIFGRDVSSSMIAGWGRITNPQHTTIAVNTLDNVLGGRFDGERLILKIDVEGWEYPVLKGATKLFAKSPLPIVLIEIHPLSDPKFAEHYAATFDFFWQRNYRIRSIEASQREATPDLVARWAGQRRCDWGVYNWVALPDWFSPSI
jgi:FkbM family methyltransferase